MSISFVRKVFLPVTTITLLLAACAPHPGAGTWQAEGDNVYGIVRIAVLFDGKADFSTAKPQQADWHCFWGANGKNSSAFQCTSSINPEIEENYALVVGEDGIAEFSHNGKLLGRFNKIPGG